jgi:hypothetical protein
MDEDLMNEWWIRRHIGLVPGEAFQPTLRFLNAGLLFLKLKPALSVFSIYLKQNCTTVIGCRRISDLLAAHGV